MLGGLRVWIVRVQVHATSLLPHSLSYAASIVRCKKGYVDDTCSGCG
jgi:hypothetical protein